MTSSLKDFKLLFRERLLNLLWRQWTALGVTGRSSPWQQTPVDPEALLLVSCTLARHDARLFDAILDWMDLNGHYLNVQRVRRLLSDAPFKGGTVFAAMAATTSTPALAIKWARSSQSPANGKRSDEPLFLMPDGKPLPVLHDPDPVFLSHGFVRDTYVTRGVAQPFRTHDCATLILRLRALIGVSARCEILAYLLHNRYGSPRAVARSCGYYPATIIKALTEMADSGFVASRMEGRQRHYSLTPDTWRTLFLGEVKSPWIAWPSLFSALEQIWLYLDAPERDEQSPLAQASSLRRILKSSVQDNLARCGLGLPSIELDAYSGETLMPYFLRQMTELLNAVDSAG